MNDCRVVLVRPHFSGNIGSVARVMHNFGLAKLLLVDPAADHRSVEARRLATHGEFILDSAIVLPDLSAAVSDCVLVAATSAKVAGVVRETVCASVRQLMPRVAESLRSGPAALVFGPEPSGLTTAEISRCHGLLHVPTNPAFPTLNLAQAVAICLYELHEAWQSPSENPVNTHDPASFAEQERMLERLEHALTTIHFLYGPKAESLMSAIRHLIGRAGPTASEVKILHGLARQLEWVALHGPNAAPQDPHDRSEP